MNIRTLIRLTLLLFVLTPFTGCGKNKEQPKTEAKAPTQVAAKVNTEEITVHQINNILARSPNVKPEAASGAKREILNKLVDQTLAKQEAIHDQLDRMPNIVQAIEAARDEILARAYIQKMLSSQPRPTEEEVKKYYDEHPELFTQRRVFSIEEILVEPKTDFAGRLQEQVTKARSMQDISAWLKSQDVKFSANRGVRAAEQIPLDRLSRLQEMKDGAIQMFGEGDGPFQVFRIVASKVAPVDLATATPRIQQFIFNRRSTELVAKEIKRLRDKAEITYAGEFAEGVAADAARAKADAAAKAKAEADAKAKSDAEARAREEELSKTRAAAETKTRLEAEAKARDTQSKPVELPQGALEKGVKGLR